MITFRVVDLQSGTEQWVEANRPEIAATLALGIQLVRSGNKKDLRAKVYFRNTPDQPVSMVRLYGKAEDRDTA